MAILRVDASFNLEPLFKLQQAFPELNGRVLALIGKRSRFLLKNEYLSGQDLTLWAFPRDKKGRYTITSDVNRRRTQVKIYSYPVNLFERGRRLRSGRKEPGKHIITRKLKQSVMSRRARYISEAENKIVDDVIKKAGAS